MKRSRRWKEAAAKINRLRDYQLDEGLGIIKDIAKSTKFDETIELTVNLGVDPRKADQMVRGTVALPHGTGKTVRVLVLTKGEKQAEAREAGADYIGFEEYIEKIQNGWLEFDVCIATPDAMREVGKLGKLLGPRGLMPNPKTGTVTFDVGVAVREVKGGRIDFRVDKFGIIHSGVGKATFSVPFLRENILEFLRTVLRLKPASSKGTYVKKITVTSTMGPGIKIDRTSLLNEIKV